MTVDVTDDNVPSAAQCDCKPEAPKLARGRILGSPVDPGPSALQASEL
jgi:hypothetical protein